MTLTVVGLRAMSLPPGAPEPAEGGAFTPTRVCGRAARLVARAAVASLRAATDSARLFASVGGMNAAVLNGRADRARPPSAGAEAPPFACKRSLTVRLARLQLHLVQQAGTTHEASKKQGWSLCQRVLL